MFLHNRNSSEDIVNTEHTEQVSSKVMTVLKNMVLVGVIIRRTDKLLHQSQIQIKEQQWRGESCHV